MLSIVLIALMALGVGASPASAQPPVNQLAEQSKLLNPLEVAKDDSLIVKLKKERFNERLKLHQRLSDSFGDLKFTTNSRAMLALCESICKLTDEGAAFEAVPKDRLKWHEMKIEQLATVEKTASVILNSPMPGEMTQATLFQIKITRLDAEIQFVELKAEIEKGRK